MQLLMQVTPGADHSIVTENLAYRRVVSCVSECMYNCKSGFTGLRCLDCNSIAHRQCFVCILCLCQVYVNLRYVQMGELTHLPDGRLFLCNGAQIGMLLAVQKSALFTFSVPCKIEYLAKDS